MENKKFFLKLITNEKIFVSESEFCDWLNRARGDFLAIKKEKATIFLPRENVLLGGELKDIE